MEQSRSTYISWLALAVTAATAALFYPQFSLNHDTSWYLVATRMFLEGEPLYAGIVELNPPLVFYQTVPAIWIADSTGLAEATAFYIYAIALGVLASSGCHAVLRRSQLESDARHTLFLGVLLGLFVIPIGSFGQREHLMLLFAAPYFLLLITGSGANAMGVRSKFLFGLVAALGLGLKPYFLLIPGMIVAAGSAGSLFKRAFEPQNLGLGVGLLTYLCFVVIAHPEYLTQIVPMANLVYHSFESYWAQVLIRFEFLAFACLCALFAWKSDPRDPLDWRILGATVSALLCYLVQFKGWNYQFVPLNFFIALAALWLIYSRSVLAKRRIVFALLAIVVLCLTLGNQIRLGPYRSHLAAHFSRYVERPGQTILVLSSNVSAAFPFVNEVKGRWASRYPTQWPVPGALVGRSIADCSNARNECKAFDAILARTRAVDIEDLEHFAPDLVYIDDRRLKTHFDGMRFDYLEFLRADPRFPGIWSQYQYRGRVVGYTVWSKVADKSAAKR